MNMPLSKTITVEVKLDCNDFFQAIEEGSLDPFSLVGIARRAILALTPESFTSLAAFFAGNESELAVLRVLRYTRLHLLAIEDDTY